MMYIFLLKPASGFCVWWLHLSVYYFKNPEGIENPPYSGGIAVTDMETYNSRQHKGYG